MKKNCISKFNNIPIQQKQTSVDDAAEELSHIFISAATMPLKRRFKKKTDKPILHQQNILVQSLTLYTQNNCSIWCWWKTVEVYKIANMYIEYYLMKIIPETH
jgi:hypothetical protein